MKTVAAAIIRDQDRVLVTRRKEGQKLAGFWEFPGGKVEQGETIQQCLEREMLEEFNWVVQAGEAVASSTYTYGHETIELIALETRILSGEVVMAVHDRMEWVPVDRILGYQLAPADIRIARELMQLHLE